MFHVCNCVWVHTGVCIGRCVSVCVWVCVCACVCMCACVCVCVCVCGWVAGWVNTYTVKGSLDLPSSRVIIREGMLAKESIRTTFLI